MTVAQSRVEALEAIRQQRAQAEQENRQRLETLVATGVIAREPHRDVVGLRGGKTVAVEKDSTLEKTA
jgi:hypothetical protein